MRCISPSGSGAYQSVQKGAHFQKGASALMRVNGEFAHLTERITEEAPGNAMSMDEAAVATELAAEVKLQVSVACIRASNSSGSGAGTPPLMINSAADDSNGAGAIGSEAE